MDFEKSYLLLIAATTEIEKRIDNLNKKFKVNNRKGEGFMWSKDWDGCEC